MRKMLWLPFLMLALSACPTTPTSIKPNIDPAPAGPSPTVPDGN